ncbi:MAG: hypothetical protein AABY26_03055 [Nanoarchaeota archaeon]
MYPITHPAFRTLIEKSIPLERLEKRLRPFNCSQAGFLGKDESLLEVVYADWKVVEEAGTTHEEIAELLGFCQPKSLSDSHQQEAIEAVNQRLNNEYEFFLTGDLTNGFQKCPWPGCKNIRGITLGLLAKRGAIKPDESLHDLAEPEEVITREMMIVTRLLPHLVGEHYFFEGRGTPYRADPTFLINAFNLRK